MQLQSEYCFMKRSGLEPDSQHLSIEGSFPKTDVALSI